MHHNAARKLFALATKGAGLLIWSSDSNSVVQSIPLPSPAGSAWCCCWSLRQPLQLYAGLNDGSVALFDLRNTGTPIRTLLAHLPRPVPIHTIAAMPPAPSRPSSLGAPAIPRPGQSLATEGAASYECLLASHTAIYGVSSDLREDRLVQLVGAEGRGSCTSLAFDAAYGQAVASWRAPALNATATEVARHDVLMWGAPVAGGRASSLQVGRCWGATRGPGCL